MIGRLLCRLGLHDHSRCWTMDRIMRICQCRRCDHPIIAWRLEHTD